MLVRMVKRMICPHGVSPKKKCKKCTKKWGREYYLKNKTSLIEKQKEYYQEHKEEIKRKHLEWKGYEGYREKFCEICGTIFKPKSNKSKVCSKECKKKLTKKATILREKRLLEKAIRLIGNKCIICGTKKSILFHEIYSKPHNGSLYYIINHAKDFTPICHLHHIILHITKKGYLEYLKYQLIFDKLLDVMNNE